MINKTELRIGNKVLLGNDIVTVKEIGEFELSFDDGKFLFTYDRFKPIELSPAILEACGFEHKGGWMGKKFVTQIYDEETEIVFEVMDNVLVIYANDIRVRKIDNPVLHQIMNCWLEFTGTELSVNLEKVKV